MIYQWLAFVSISACGILFSIWRNEQAKSAKHDLANAVKRLDELEQEKNNQRERYEAAINLLHASIADMRKELDAANTPQSVLNSFNRLFPPKA